MVLAIITPLHYMKNVEIESLDLLLRKLIHLLFGSIISSLSFFIASLTELKQLSFNVQIKISTCIFFVDRPLLDVAFCLLLLNKQYQELHQDDLGVIFL